MKTKRALDIYYEMMYLLEDDPVEKLYNQFFTKYIGPNSTLWDNWAKQQAPKGAENSKKRIKELLDSGFKVKCGYSATSVRGYHVHYILWR